MMSLSLFFFSMAVELSGFTSFPSRTEALLSEYETIGASTWAFDSIDCAFFSLKWRGSMVVDLFPHLSFISPFSLALSLLWCEKDASYLTTASVQQAIRDQLSIRGTLSSKVCCYFSFFFLFDFLSHDCMITFFYSQVRNQRFFLPSSFFQIYINAKECERKE